MLVLVMVISSSILHSVLKTKMISIINIVKILIGSLKIMYVYTHSFLFVKLTN